MSLTGTQKSTTTVENKEICIEDVYKLLLNSSQEISKKIDGVENKLKNIEQKYDQTIEQLEDKVQTIETENKELKSRLAYIERNIRKNLVIYGIFEETGENLCNIIEKLITGKLALKLEKFDVVRVFRLGKVTQRPRPVLIELFSELKKQEIIRSRQKLKGTHIYITEDLTVEQRKEKKVQVDHLKLARSKNKFAQLKGNKLIVDGETYAYADLVGNKYSDGYYSPSREILSEPSTPTVFTEINYNDPHTDQEQLHMQLTGQAEKQRKTLLGDKRSGKEKETKESKEKSNPQQKEKESDQDERIKKLENSSNQATGNILKITKTRTRSQK